MRINGWHRPWIPVGILGLTLLCCNNPSAPSSPSSCPVKGSMSARIDGVSWTAACVDAFYETTFNRFTVTGSTPDHTESLTLTVVATEPGDYPLGGPVPPSTSYPHSTAGLNLNCHGRGSCPAWNVVPCCGQPDGNGSGIVTVSRLSPTAASGSFSLSMVPNTVTGASGVKTVTNGSFGVTF